MDRPLRELGFARRDHRQIWEHNPLRLIVQVAGSELPPQSETTTVSTAAGDVELWSATDLIVDRLSNAVVWNQRDRVAQALVLRFVGGLDESRGRRRAQDDDVEAAFDAFLELVAEVDASDEDGAVRAVAAFWRRVDPEGARTRLNAMSRGRTPARMAGASSGLLFLAAKAQTAPRLMPRDAASREALKRVGERPERLGPAGSRTRPAAR